MIPDVSRRAFLTTTAAATLIPALPAATPAATDLKLGVASYSFRKFSRADAIKNMKALGLRYINIKEFHSPYKSTPEEIAAARKEFEDAGLVITGGGTITLQKDDDADIRKYFDYAKACGFPLMVIAPTQQTMPRIEKFVKEYDIKTAIHNHGPEDKYFPSPYDVLKVVQNMDPRCGLCMDIGHTARTGTDPVKAAKDAGPRLLDMHAKDLRDLMDKGSQCDVGDGKMPIAAVFHQLEAMGYPGYVNLEYEIHDTDPMPGMQKSFSYMRGVLAGLKG